MVTIVGQVSNQDDSPQNAAPGTWSLGGLQFDAWLRLHHNTSLTVTQHPVEVGAAISDHAYVNPRRFSFDIGMTDVIAGVNFSGTSSSRSVNAYQALINLQYQRTPLRLISKYGTFDNILVIGVDTADDFRSKNAMVATITLQQVIMASSQIAPMSANTHATDQTARGIVQSVGLGIFTGTISNVGQTVAKSIVQSAQSGITNFAKSAVKAAKGWLGSLFR